MLRAQGKRLFWMPAITRIGPEQHIPLTAPLVPWRVEQGSGGCQCHGCPWVVGKVPGSSRACRYPIVTRRGGDGTGGPQDAAPVFVRAMK